MISRNMDCETINHFDRLPDDLLRLILNRVLHAKSLCACLAVSTRFNSLALHSTSISLSVDSIHFNDDDDNDLLPNDSSPSLLHSFIRLFISKPLRFLTTLASRASSTLNNNNNATAAFYSPTDALKSFSRIEVLKIQLPSHGELQLDKANHPLLNWKATFGCELKTCVIVAGTAYDHIKKPNPVVDYYDEERPPGWVESETGCAIKDEQDGDGVISNDDLKMRVVWTISCLIAASSRHHLLKRIVAQHPMLKWIEMVDERRQGTLTMGEADISEMRNKQRSISEYEVSTDRTRIPALKMKMWHAAELELPECNKVMRGATLVLIGAAADGEEEEVVGVEGMFDDEMMYGEVAKEIRKKMKQSYSLEMDSF